MSDAEAIFRWLATLAVVSVALAPAVWWLSEGLGQARHGLLRPIGMILATALLWWPAAVFGIPFTRLTLGVAIVLAGVCCWTLWLRTGDSINWRPLIGFEAVWVVLFSGYAFFRSYHPDIANTEKPMDIALLSSVSRSADVPAPDPWFAGETINYYYFGYQTVASMVKLSGVPASIAFNLALATLFASIGTVAVAAGYRIALTADSGRYISFLSAALAAFFVLLAGNLETAWRLLQDPTGTIEHGWWYSGVGWQASRVIVDHGVHGNPDPRNTINEFPAFSFILGDLHPHVLTYPLLLGVLALVVGIFLSPSSATVPRVASIGGLTGLLYVSNSWDAPVGFTMLLGALLFLSGWKSRRTWILAGIAAASALAVALPFVSHYTAPVGLTETEIPNWLRAIPVLGTTIRTVGIVNWRPSGAGELLLVHGPWMAGFILFTVLAFVREPAAFDIFRRRIGLLAVGALLAGSVAIVWAPGVLLLGVPAGIGATIAVFARSSVVRVVAALFALGFSLAFIPEFLYIQDAFGDRMNTVFKLYFQAWLLLAVATAVTLAVAISAPSRTLSRISIATATLTLVATAPYAPISSRDWTDNFATRRGLDGAGFIESADPGDASAIHWLIENAPQDVILVEGPGCSYGSISGVPMNRISAFSGVPTIIGWEGHERQWRRGEDPPVGPRIDRRQAIANQWLDGHTAEAMGLPVPEYIILGTQERAGSDACEPLVAHDVESSRFALEASGWIPVHESENVVILAHP